MATGAGVWIPYVPLPDPTRGVTMAVDEDRRSRSYQRLAEAIGRDEAVTIFELLPPSRTELATRADLEVFEGRFDAVDQRFDAVDQRFDAVDQRFDDLRRDIDHRVVEVHGRLDRIDDHLRDLRSEVVAAIAGQTRALVLGVLTATVSIGGLSAVLSQL
jgi:tetrahydromethanopterin S-methyltransferase subunit G